MGMVQIVEIRQRGFSVRYPHNEFVTKYGPIVGRGPGQPGFQGPGADEHAGPAAWREEAERVSSNPFLRLWPAWGLLVDDFGRERSKRSPWFRCFFWP